MRCVMNTPSVDQPKETHVIDAKDLTWPITVTINTANGPVVISHVLGHDPRFGLGMYR